MAKCLCGCRQEVTRKSRFIQGHDQKLRTCFEKSIGGADNLIKLKRIVDKIGYEKVFALLKNNR